MFLVGFPALKCSLCLCRLSLEQTQLRSQLVGLATEASDLGLERACLLASLLVLFLELGCLRLQSHRHLLCLLQCGRMLLLCHLVVEFLSGRQNFRILVLRGELDIFEFYPFASFNRLSQLFCLPGVKLLEAVNFALQQSKLGFQRAERVVAH